MSSQIADVMAGSPPLSKVRWSIPVLAFLAVFLDGFDTTSIGFVVPTLSKAWSLPPAAFTGSFVATSVGAVIGYMLSGRLAAHWGRRSLLLSSVALFAIGSLATALATSLASLAILRLVTAIGLGAALPAAVSLAVAQVLPRQREAMTIAVVSGLSFGAFIGGLVAGKLIVQFGWASLFIVGGILPLLLLVALWFVLPREAGAVAVAAKGTRTGTSTSDQAAASKVSSLFAGSLRLQTLSLWAFAFFNFTAFYALISWTPSLLVAMGFQPAEAPIGGAVLGGGGLIGAILLVPLSAWLGTRRVLVAATVIGLALIVCIGKVDLDRTGLLLCLGGLGACLVAGSIGQSAMAVAIYPVASRTNGVGWSAALGRIGSIVGPAVGGGLMAAALSPRDVLMAACVPVLASALALLALGLYAERNR